MRRAALIGIAAVAAIGLGAFAFIWFSGGSGQPTTQLTTPPLATDTTGADTPEPTTDDAVPTTDEAVPTTPATDPGSARTFVLGEGSQARFELDEELRGSPKHVVGTTPEVVGQVRFDPTDPAGAELSDILINARTFQTDSSNRDRAIRSAVVLDSGSDEFELITFRPTSVDGLAGPLAVGDTVMFSVTGELSIKGVAQPTTFDVEATWLDENTLEGTAEAVVDRTDFGIGIPSVASVANVTEEVLIALDFVAVAG